MSTNTLMKPRWLNLPLAVLLGISAVGVAVGNFYFVVDSYSWNLDRVVGAPFFERTIRGPLKQFFDTHAFIYLLMILCYPLFGLSASITGIRWVRSSSESKPSRHRLLRGIVYAVCIVPLIVVGWVIGGISANFGLWLAPLSLGAVALLSELSCPPRHLAWLRPLIWGAILGAVAELAK